MARHVALAAQGDILRPEKGPGRGQSVGRGPGPPSVRRHLPGQTRAEYARRKRRVIFWKRGGGWIASQLRPAGTALCRPAKGNPEELLDADLHAVLSIALPIGSTMIYRNVRPTKISGVLRKSNVNTNILRARPANCVDNVTAEDRAGSAYKRNPQFLR